MKGRAVVSDWNEFTHNGKQLFKESEFLSRGIKPVIDLGFMRKLFKARVKANVPFVITSGGRTIEHNKSVGGTANSDHLFGGNLLTVCGCDIAAPDSGTRYKIIKACMEAGLDRFKVYKGKKIIHVGLSLRNPGGMFMLD